MDKRQLVQIPAEQIKKLNEIDNIRLDLSGYSISKKVHILLQEILSQLYNRASNLSHPIHNLQEDKKYIEYIRGVIPLHSLSSTLIGVPKYSQQTIGKQIKTIVAIVKDNMFRWINRRDEFDVVAEYLLKKLKNFDERKKYKELYIELFNNVNVIVNDILKKDLKKVSKSNLIDIYKDLHEAAEKFFSISWDIDPMDIALEEKMIDLLRKSLKDSLKEYDEAKFTESYGLINTPIETSFINKEKILLFNAYLFVRKNKIPHDAILDNKQLRGYIDEFIEKYWWTELTWNGGIIKDECTFIEKVDELSKLSPRDFDKLYSELKNYSKDIKNKKEIIKKKYNFNDELLYLIDLFEMYANFHDLRKEVQMKSTYAFSRLFSEFSRRINIDVHFFQWMWFHEVLQLLEHNSINKEVIEQRFNSLYIDTSTFPHIITLQGKEAEKKINETSAAEQKSIENIDGLSASLGKATGIARVCLTNIEAISKVKEGDILVTSMTMPDFVPIMKKAAAIVTDEGGATCHAAIIARELKIPCIVGTKIATKIIKDGMLIEVNANHGVVKLLNNN